MPPRLEIGERILLTLWVGGMWAIGYLAAPTLFHMLDDRRLAGSLAGQMFTAMSLVGLVCGGLLLVSAIYSAGKQWARAWRVWVLIVMLGIVAVGEFGLTPIMGALRESGLVPGSAAAVRFGRLHGIASTLFLIASLLGLVLVIFGPRRTVQE
jgi:hypothetical protein